MSTTTIVCECYHRVDGKLDAVIARCGSAENVVKSICGRERLNFGMRRDEIVLCKICHLAILLIQKLKRHKKIKSKFLTLLEFSNIKT